MNNKPIKFKHVRFLIYICQRLGLDMYIICIFIYYMYLLSFWIVVIIVIIIKIRRDSLNLTIFIYVVFLVSIYICVFRLRYYDFHLYFNVEKRLIEVFIRQFFLTLNFQTSILEFQPSILCFQPSILEHQPAIQKCQPSIFYLQLFIFDLQTAELNFKAKTTKLDDLQAALDLSYNIVRQIVQTKYLSN